MIIGIIVFILSSLGIYGFFIGNYTFTTIALIAIIIEYILGFLTGQSKGFGVTFWLSIIIGIILSNNMGLSIWACISVCLCFENVILFPIGLIMLVIFSKKLKNQEE